MVVQLPPMAEAQAESWAALLELAPELGENWILVGGQMVFLHLVERQAQNPRPTDDVDVVIDIKAEQLSRIHATLLNAGFTQQLPNVAEIAHRYRRSVATVDVLAPDNIGDRADLRIGAGRTLSAPGSRQAINRSESVTVEADGHSAQIRRPNLIGALVGKDAAVGIASQRTAERQKHLRDCSLLAEVMGPSDRGAANLNDGEVKRLGKLLEHDELSALARRNLQLLVEEKPR